MLNKRARRGPFSDVEQGVRHLGAIGGRYTYFYDSLKAGGVIAVESRLERLNAQLADLDPNVRTIRAQPITIDVETGKVFSSRAELNAAREQRKSGKAGERYYTSDFAFGVAWRDVYVEAKDERYFGGEKYWAKVNRAADILRTSGHGFAVVCFPRTELEAIEWNASVLTCYRHARLPRLAPREQELAASYLAHGERPLGEVLLRCGLSNRHSPALFLEGVVQADLRRGRISSNLLVSAAGGDLSALALLPLAWEEQTV